MAEVNIIQHCTVLPIPFSDGCIMLTQVDYQKEDGTK